jgi:hypothetical protein
MSTVHEQVHHADSGIELMVSERTANETRDPWRFISLEVGGWSRLTPRELRDLGKWLQQQGRRMGKEYKSNGAPKLPNTDPQP